MDLNPTKETAKPGKRARAIAAGVVVAALAVGVLAAAAFWPRDREPEYQGNKLSEWVRACIKAENAFAGGTFGYTYYEVRTNRELQVLRAEADGARDVVIRLGTNSIPWLIRRVEYEIPAWRKKLFLAYARIPGATKVSPVCRLIRGPEPITVRAQILPVFMILREQGKAAAPELARVVRDPKTSSEAKRFARRCLDEIEQTNRF